MSLGCVLLGRQVVSSLLLRICRRATVKQLLADLARPALHAQTLGFSHPITGERMQFSSPLPQDFDDAMHRLRAL